MSCGDLFLGLIAILFPPVAVWIKSGLCTCDSLINIMLCCLGYLPGLIHAWYIIASHPERDYDYEPIPDTEAGRGDRVTHYYVSHTQGPDRGGYGTQTQGSKTGPNRPAPPPPRQPQGSGQQSSVNAGPSGGPAVGDDAVAPPTYQDAVKGDNKIQSPN